MLQRAFRALAGSASLEVGLGIASALLRVELGLLVGGGILVASSAVYASPTVSIAQLSLRDQSTTTAQSTPGSSSPESTPDTISNSRFSCQYENGSYTVMYSPLSQPGQFYPWATPSTLGGGWTPELRCNEISRRLESYRPDGLLELRTGVENGYNTICVTTEQVPGCRIVLTVPPGQNPEITRDRVFSNLTVADNGQQTNAVNTFSGNDDAGAILGQIGQAIGVDLSSVTGQRQRSSRSAGIDLRPFLDRADGGTGSRLR